MSRPVSRLSTLLMECWPMMQARRPCIFDYPYKPPYNPTKIEDKHPESPQEARILTKADKTGSVSMTLKKKRRQQDQYKPAGTGKCELCFNDS
ncbi:MAG: hypothetical protein ACPLZY_02645 [Candidatus Norongarragalinales archaeon]